MMDSVPKSIRNLGAASLSKVADKFVDFIITRYTGKSVKIFEAESDIEADKVKTKWEVLEKPFWLEAEARKMNRQYLNFGSVLLKATPLITATSTQVENDNDVFWGLVEHSKEISNEEIQELIAKIIAGEYNKPGTYTMSALQTIKMLGKNEIELFERVCSFLIYGNQLPYRLFTGSEDVKEMMEKNQVDFGHLQILQSLGLFFPSGMRRTVDAKDNNKVSIKYSNKNLIYEPIREGIETIHVPQFYELSPVGAQILVHLNPVFIEEYFEWLKQHYKLPNYKFVEIT